MLDVLAVSIRKLYTKVIGSGKTGGDKVQIIDYKALNHQIQ